ncbi:MAG: DUF2235 domain-containing protein [Flavobacteriaceae bacterium]|nr:DUF2235 domain-containing protein [Flavobacteriaceae bacterium]
MSGKIIETAGEEIIISGESISLRANDGNFVTNAGANNNWHAKEGHEMGDFEAVKVDSEKEIHLEIGVFFDGTLNNKFNTNLGIEGAPSKIKMFTGSYRNDHTNVARLSDLYLDETEDVDDTQTVKFPIYVGGVGTSLGKVDDIITMGTGEDVPAALKIGASVLLGGLGLIIAEGYDIWNGDRSIKGKVNDAIRDIVKRIVFLKIKKIKSITFDVFGFSRGAASARHFCNGLKETVIEIDRKYNMKGWQDVSFTETKTSNVGGDLYKKLIGKVTEIPTQFNIRFIGLFDTVAAVLKMDAGDFSADDASHHGIHLDVSGLKAQKVVHLTAQDEHRKNFSLNSISTGSTYRMYGVHSDIGGGYNTEIETVSLGHGTKESDKARLENERLQWIKEGWYLEGEITVENNSVITTKKVRQGTLITTIKHSYLLIGTKKVFNHYTFIPLHFMHLLAKNSKVPLKGVKEDHKVPEDLKKVDKIYKTFVRTEQTPEISDDDLRLLRHKYIHQSANFNNPTLGVYANAPVKERSEFEN